MENSSPIFVLGNPRSGTSLLRLMLNSHPNLVIPPESGFLEWWYKKYADWDLLDINTARQKEFIEDLITSKKFETWEFDSNLLIATIQREMPNSYSQLIACVYISYGLQQGKKNFRWGDKNNYYVNKLELINNLYPRATYVHIIRDGRDVACSYKEINKLESFSEYKPKLPSDIQEIAKSWVANNSIILSFFSTIATEQYLTIRLEDLLLKTEQTLKNLCQLIAISYNKEMLKYYIHNKKLGMEPQSTLDWKKKTLEKPDPSIIGRYMNGLSEEEISNFNAISYDLLKKFHYL